MDKVFMAIDCGNSRLKATVFPKEGSGEEVVSQVFEVKDLEGLLLFMEKMGVEAAAMVSVGGTDVRMVETLRQAVDDEFMLLTHSTPLPIRIGYATPATLGLDRVAAAAGAASLFPGKECVVADAGTALTIDLLTADGLFAGGSISPGVSMRFVSLHSGTALLPLVDAESLSTDGRWARDTKSAIAAGVVEGMADQLQCSMKPGAILILTGGDGNLLYNVLMRRDFLPHDAEIILSPNLVALGLRYIFDEYEK